MNLSDTIVTIICIILFLFAIAIGWHFFQESLDCDSRGGVYIRTFAGYTCVENVIQLKK